MNVVAIMGRLTSTPEIKTTQSGISVSSFTVAVDRSFVKQGEERQTDFINVVAWRNTAEFICRYFIKGQMIAISGSIQTRNYTDKDGKNRKAFEVLADRANFTESRQKSPDINPRDSAPSGDDFTVVEDSDDLPF